MNQFQPIKFRDIGEFLDYLPPDQLVITERLRELASECIPDVKEKLAYNVPFFYRHRRICFIWPAAVPWGKVEKDGVQLGFCEGHLLKDDSDYLDKGNRKQVYWKVFHHLNEIDVDLIRSYLYEAVEIDRELHLMKSGK